MKLGQYGAAALLRCMNQHPFGVGQAPVPAGSGLKLHLRAPSLEQSDLGNPKLAGLLQGHVHPFTAQQRQAEVKVEGRFAAPILPRISHDQLAALWRNVTKRGLGHQARAVEQLHGIAIAAAKHLQKVPGSGIGEGYGARGQGRGPV